MNEFWCEKFGAKLNIFGAKSYAKHWIIGADKNDLKIDAILSLNQQFKQCVKFPTRLTPPAILDIIITDLGTYYMDPVCESPLDVDSDKTGSPSDHLMVVMEQINSINNQKDRIKKTFNYRAFTDAAFNAMDQELDKIDWSSIFYDTCFPQKRKTVVNESQPFFTEKLSKLKRKKCREYNKHRKSAKYDELSRIYVKELNNAKKGFYRKRICSLRSSNTRQWFKNVKKLINPDEGTRDVIILDAYSAELLHLISFKY